MNEKNCHNMIMKYIIPLIISFLIAFVSELSIPNQAIYQKMLWIILSIFAGIDICYKFFQKKTLDYFFCLIPNFFPFLFAVFFTFFVNFQNDQYGLIKQSFTTSCFILTDILLVCFLLSKYKNKAFNIIENSILISYGISLMIAIKNIGFIDCFLYLFNSNPIYSKYFEKHDIGVAVIPFILYYLYLIILKKVKLETTKKIKLILLILIMILCGKRSAFLSLITGTIIIMFLKFIENYKCKKNLIISLLLFTLFGCYIYVVMIKFGVLSSIENILNINSMGRTYVYEWFNQYYNLSPLYIGKGFQFVHRYMTLGLGDTMVNAFGYLHNSVLQIYIEMGFIGFFIWFGFILFAYPYFIKSKYGIYPFYICIILTLSTIAMYLVDNVLTYPVFLISFFVVLGNSSIFNDKEVL